jgi:C1A family cysteine protease
MVSWPIRTLARLLPQKKKIRFLDSITRVGGAIPSPKDKRDYPAPALQGGADLLLPEAFSLRHDILSIEDQGYYNSCVTNAGCAVLEVFSKNNGFTHPMELSRMDAWNKTRKESGTYPDNKGCYIRDFWRVAQSADGITIEKLMPYTESSYNQPTPFAAQIFRKWYLDFIYVWIPPSLEDRRLHIKLAIYRYRTPVLFALALKPSFHNPDTRTPYKPKSGEHTTVNHAMIVTGYNEENDTFEILNSWGRLWGDGGFIYIDGEYFVRNAVDLSYPIPRKV